MDTQKLKRLIEIKDLIAELSNEDKEIRQEILSDANFQDIEVATQESKFAIKVITKRTPKIKDWYDDEFISMMFPEAVKTKISIDMSALEKNTEAAEFIEISKSTYVDVREVKEKKK